MRNSDREIDGFAISYMPNMMQHCQRLVSRGLLCAALCGILFAASTSVASAQSTSNHRLQLEAAACRLISFTPLPGPGAQEAIALPNSTASALMKTGNRSLESVVRAFEKAALALNNDAAINALNDGVKVCHRLGLPTAA
jgi:hypothetical protein